MRRRLWIAGVLSVALLALFSARGCVEGVQMEFSSGSIRRELRVYEICLHRSERETALSRRVADLELATSEEMWRTVRIRRPGVYISTAYEGTLHASNTLAKTLELHGVPPLRQRQSIRRFLLLLQEGKSDRKATQFVIELDRQLADADRDD